MKNKHCLSESDLLNETLALTVKSIKKFNSKKFAKKFQTEVPDQLVNTVYNKTGG